MGVLDFILWRVPEGPRPWYKIVLWWELRRIPYNVIVGLTGAISGGITLYYAGGLGNPILVVLLYGLGANACYTAGWMTELIITKLLSKDWSGYAAVTYASGLIFSVGVTVFPVLVILLLTLAGYQNPSPYAHMTSVEPSKSELVGRYELTKSDLSWKYRSDLSPNTPPWFELHEDGTFECSEWRYLQPGVFSYSSSPFYPTPTAAYDETGSGHWELRTSVGEDWQVLMTFEPSPGETEEHYACYYILEDSPPHRFYEIIGDPDSGEGNWFEKVE